MKTKGLKKPKAHQTFGNSLIRHQRDQRDSLNEAHWNENISVKDFNKNREHIRKKNKSLNQWICTKEEAGVWEVMCLPFLWLSPIWY